MNIQLRNRPTKSTLGRHEGRTEHHPFIRSYSIRRARSCQAPAPLADYKFKGAESTGGLLLQRADRFQVRRRALFQWSKYCRPAARLQVQPFALPSSRESNCSPSGMNNHRLRLARELILAEENSSSKLGFSLAQFHSRIQFAHLPACCSPIKYLKLLRSSRARCFNSQRPVYGRAGTFA